MKIILSRKGFDNQHGGQPSPILPDGTLLSLPIPMDGERLSFADLKYGDHSYFDIIKSLHPKTTLKAKTACHLDPDLHEECLKRPETWQPLFGQMGSALAHLQNNEVGKDDLFLFFGTFRETEYLGSKLKYKKEASDIHLIYAYFQVKQLHTNKMHLQEYFSHHPHAQSAFLDKNFNGIFEANEKLSFDTAIDGAGMLRYHKDLVLTKPGYSKSRWDLPSSFKEAHITYHSSRSFKPDYFQSAAKGQEFIISGSPEVKNWADSLIDVGRN